MQFMQVILTVTFKCHTAFPRWRSCWITITNKLHACSPPFPWRYFMCGHLWKLQLVSHKIYVNYVKGKFKATKVLTVTTEFTLLETARSKRYGGDSLQMSIDISRSSWSYLTMCHCLLYKTTNLPAIMARSSFKLINFSLL